MSGFSRGPEIRRRRARKEKIAGLRRRYAATKSDADRKKILEKALRVAPTLSSEEFLKPLERKPA
ncbi:MAG TPA: DUF6800 family protein [Terriglobales bacterium]|jgi:hypothetical protein|nr:DUF6800 family protein [Terriglobales bacterium]